MVDVDQQLGAAAPRTPRASASSPGTIRAVSNRTAETSTAAVRSSTAAASRSASVSTGAAGTRTTSSPASPSRASWRRSVWNSPSVVTSRGRAREVEGREEAQDELVRVRAERDGRAGVAEQRADGGP